MALHFERRWTGKDTPEVTCGVRGLGERERSLAHGVSHLGLDLNRVSSDIIKVTNINDLPQNGAEPHSECISLLFEQIVSLVCSLETQLHARQSPEMILKLK